MKELIKPEFYQNTFIILFTTAALILVITKFWYNKRLSLNITMPNVYIFEFESQLKYFLSPYNINTGLFKIITYTLYIISTLKIIQTNLNLSIDKLLNWKKLLLLSAGYFIIKFLIETIFILIIKKSHFLHKIRFVRITYENYALFYLFFAGFLIFYFPYHSIVFLYLTVSISVIWIISAWINIFLSLRKHTELSTFQNILYLCLSEILPFILAIGWIIFQIL